MTEVIPMTEEQEFKLEICRLPSKNNSVTGRAFALISVDQPKLGSFRLHYNDDSANPDFTSRTIEAVHKSKEVLDLFTTEAWCEPRNQFG